MAVDVIIGPPGTGKTTSLATQVRGYVADGQTPLVTSLTKAAATEIAGRGLLVRAEQVGTLHAHALRALDFPTLTVGQEGEWNEDNPDWDLTSGGETDVDDLTGGATGATTADGLCESYHLLRARMVERDLWPDNVAEFAGLWEAWKAERCLSDFTDLIEHARILDTRPPGDPSVILADEAQDHSRLELELLRHWSRHVGTLTLVGDPWQALYTWRGAHPAMFSDKRIMDRRAVLAQSYRVPQAVHAAACAWIKGLSDWEPIEYAPRPVAGSVERSSGSRSNPDGVLDLAERHLDAGQSVMIQASCAYMLGGLLAECRRRGLPFGNRWAPRRYAWSPLFLRRGVTMAQRILSLLIPLDDGEDAFQYGDNVPRWSPRDVFRFADVLTARGILRHGAKKKLKQLGKAKEGISRTLVDDADLGEWFEPEAASFLRSVAVADVSVEEVLLWWEQRLPAARAQVARYPLCVLRKHGREALSTEPRLCVGTIHSFKGAEADVVFVFPDLSSQAAVGWSQVGECRDAILRQFYVAMTRARESLYLCDGVGYSVDWEV